jgi:hypothetical protein
MRAKCCDPCDRKLRWGDAFLGGQLGQRGHEAQVVGQCFAFETGVTRAVVARCIGPSAIKGHRSKATYQAALMH